MKACAAVLALALVHSGVEAANLRGTHQRELQPVSLETFYFCPLELNRCIASCNLDAPRFPFNDFADCEPYLRACQANPCAFNPNNVAPDTFRNPGPLPEIPPPDLNKDNDGDGLTNGEEAGLGTDPNNSDTDGDGVNDFDEGTIRHRDSRSPDFVTYSFSSATISLRSAGSQR